MLIRAMYIRLNITGVDCCTLDLRPYIYLSLHLTGSLENTRDLPVTTVVELVLHREHNELEMADTQGVGASPLQPRGIEYFRIHMIRNGKELVC